MESEICEECIMSEMQRVTITVLGRVQGVFFRDSTMRKARELGLAGTVRNLPDGSVQILAQGLPGAVQALVAWSHEGPPAALVREVRVTHSTPDPGLDDFTVTF